MKPTEEQIQAIITLVVVITLILNATKTTSDIATTPALIPQRERLKKSAMTDCPASTPMMPIYTFSPNTMRISRSTMITIPVIIGLRHQVESK